MKRTNIKETIKEHFFLNPSAKLRVREIERTLKIPLPSTIRYCKELKEEHILTTKQIGKVTFYTADKTSDQYKLDKRLFNIKKLYTSKIIDCLRQEFSNPPIILFGSYSKGEDIETSDIDLYIETPSQKEPSLKNFEKKLHRKIQIFKSKDIQNIKNKHLANNILNGITINSYIEVFK
ncbi:hypothetical protein DRJ25_01835 [Candidatus Woesearchaeota archaeon]|nr:MAG: hypothetical protein DRJ25_01835 [Candidatus Woesearchaeota archaeon]